MYFRLKKTKSTRVLQLVESFRNPEGQPRQRILLSLDDLDLPTSLCHPVAHGLENYLQGTAALFESTVEQEWVERLFREITQSSNPFESNKLDPDLSAQMHVLTDTLTHTHSTSPISFNSPLTEREMAGSTASPTAF